MDLPTGVTIASIIWAVGSTLAAGILAWGRRQGEQAVVQDVHGEDIDELSQQIEENEAKIQELRQEGILQRLKALRRDVRRHERYFESLIPRELERGGAFKLHDPEDDL